MGQKKTRAAAEMGSSAAKKELTPGQDQKVELGEKDYSDKPRDDDQARTRGEELLRITEAVQGERKMEGTVNKKRY